MWEFGKWILGVWNQFIITVIISWVASTVYNKCAAPKGKAAIPHTWPFWANTVAITFLHKRNLGTRFFGRTQQRIAPATPGALRQEDRAPSSRRSDKRTETLRQPKHNALLVKTKYQDPFRPPRYMYSTSGAKHQV